MIRPSIVEAVPPKATTEELAEALSLTLEDFVEAFGAGWHLLPNEMHDFDSDPSGMGNMFGDWHVAGEPFQLTLRPLSEGVELGVPVGHWSGPHEVCWESRERRTIYGAGTQLLDVAPLVVADNLKRRRATFRYCRYCRRQTAPEQRLSRDVCYGCGTGWQGFVY